MNMNDLMSMLWFNFFLGLNFVFLCLKLIIIHYHTSKQRKTKFKPKKKLNHNIYMSNYYMAMSQKDWKQTNSRI